MKSSKTRTVLITILFCASLASYVFLNIASAHSIVYQQESMEQNESVKLALPDVAILKKALDKIVFKPFE